MSDKSGLLALLSTVLGVVRRARPILFAVFEQMVYRVIKSRLFFITRPRVRMRARVVLSFARARVRRTPEGQITDYRLQITENPEIQQTWFSRFVWLKSATRKLPISNFNFLVSELPSQVCARLGAVSQFFPRNTREAYKLHDIVKGRHPSDHNSILHTPYYILPIFCKKFVRDKCRQGASIIAASAGALLAFIRANQKYRLGAQRVRQLRVRGVHQGQARLHLSTPAKIIGVLTLSTVSTLAGFIIQFTGQTPKPAYAAINEQLNFQARLYNASGGIASDGNYNLQFHIYSGGDGDPDTADETLEWTGSYLKGNTDGVDVANGYFNVQLGDSVSQVNTMADVDWDNSTLWLSINIGDTSSTGTTTCDTESEFDSNCGGDGEMDPFLRLTSVPYAFNSKYLGGRSSSQFAQLDPSSQQTGSIDIDGSVTAATSIISPQITTSSGDLTINPTGNLVVKGSTSDSSTSALNVTDSSDNSILRVRNDGRVGISEASPGAKLQITADNSTVGQIIKVGATPQNALEIHNSSGGTLSLITGYGRIRANNLTGGDPNYSFVVDTDTGLLYDGADAISLVTGGSQRLSIASGNVGINTTGPDRKLDVLDASNPQLRLTYTDGSVYTDLQTTSSGYLYINPSGGRLGVNNAAPGAALDVTGAGIFSSTLAVQGASTTVGTTSQSGSIILHDGNGQTVTINTSNQTVGNAIYSFPDTEGVDDEICLLNENNCATGGVVTLQNAYDNSTSPEITLDATRGGLTIRDNATPIGANLLEVQNNGGTTTYLGVTTSGISVTGNQTFAQGADRTISLDARTDAGTGYTLTVQGGGGYATGTGGAGGNLVLQGGNAGGSGANDGGDIFVYGGTKTSTGIDGDVILAHNGSAAVGRVGIGTTSLDSGVLLEVAGNVLFDTNSNAALTIQNSATNVLFKADTTNLEIEIDEATSDQNYALAVTDAQVNTALRIGTGSNYAEFTTSGLTYSGSARPSRTTTLIPEFSGATLVGDGSGNSGTMTSDFCSYAATGPSATDAYCANSGEEHNYYSWTTTTGGNDYDIWVRYRLPDDFDGFDGNITVNAWQTDDTTNDVIVNLYEEDSSTSCHGGNLNAATGTATWNGATLNPGTSCTFNSSDAGKYIIFRIQMVAAASDYVLLGEIEFNYFANY